MGMDNIVLRESIDEAVDVAFIPWNELRDSAVLITGATGLIGSTIVRVLISANRKYELNCKVIALVRDLNRAKEKFANEDLEDVLIYKLGTVEKLPEIIESIDYIIHGASQTSSKEFITRPVETIDTAVTGTKNLLELAKEKKVKGFVYLSSMEVYGYPEKGHKVKEEEVGALSPIDIRNSYPLSKQMSEGLCCAYAFEYGVPSKIARLTQTFGPGVDYNDSRIFAYFARCMVEKKDIVLKTKGETERCYLYTTDAATAILTILLRGEVGEAYNCADEATYCSIAEMAEIVAEDNSIAVSYLNEDEKENGFLNTLYMLLDTSKLQSLGWKVMKGNKGNIRYMFKCLVNTL